MFDLFWTALIVFFGYRNFKVVYIIYQRDGRMTGQAWFSFALGCLMVYFVYARLSVLGMF